MSTPDDFNWDDDVAADSVVQNSVEKVAIYANPNGDVLIRQERRWDEEDDTWIIIARGNVGAAIAKMRVAMGEEPSPARDRTAAARQRRHRQRHCNGPERDVDRDEDRDGQHDVGDELPLRMTAGE
jgi:hypothetical protein